ncbi:lipopolysaccharide biosynthesis protein [Sodalis sp. RH16]|uniref:lipopolysaccharide biosynthesis protein n=1 Tax=Sodalis sp. RH16 TaxID=3394331 RepID=UPI0039B6A6A8
MTLLSNAKWNMSSQLFKVMVQAINIIYLAKIIPPSEYGLMAMALVIFNLGVLLRDLGTSAVIIQRKELTNSLINTVFWLNLLMGIGLALIITVSAPFIASLYHQPKLTNVLMLLSITFPLSSCASAHLALLERESQFKKVSVIEITSSLASVIVAIILANFGYGVYSLVAQAIVLNMMSAIQFWMASSWRPKMSLFIDMKELRNIFGFSANLSLFNFINYFSRNSDSFIIGKFMSSAVLGYYNLAYRIMLFPLQSLSFVATRSLYPILSKSQDDDEEVLRTYLNCIFIVLMITTPLMSGIAFYSEPFVRLVIGPQWHLTGDILKWLAPTAIIQAVLSTSGSVFMAKGRTDILMRLGIVGTILQVGSFIIGIRFDITKFAMCYLIANILNFFPVMFFLLRIINGTLSCFFKKIYAIFVSSFVMIAALTIFNNFYPMVKIINILSLVMLCFLGVIVYSFALFTTSPMVRLAVISKFSKIK